MTDYYHSTTKLNKKRILSQKRIKFANFNTTDYIDNILEVLSYQNTLKEFPLTYPEASGNARFMGEGLYCLENLDDAKNYHNDLEHVVIGLEMKNNFSIYEMDDISSRRQINEVLTNREKSDLYKFLDRLSAEERKVWLTFIQLLRKGLYEDYKTVPQMVGIVIHILQNFAKPHKFDVYSKKFYVKIKGKDMLYVLVKNKKSIFKIYDIYEAQGGYPR